MFDRLDSNGDGVVTKDELPAEAQVFFDRLDTDGNGEVTFEEAETLRQNMQRMRQRTREMRGDRAPAEGVLDLAYANNDNVRQRLYLALPDSHDASEKIPLVIYIHGGGWSGGNRDGFARPNSPFALGGKAAVASIGYRLTGEAAWPAQEEDCVAGVRYLVDHAEEYGLDTSRIALIGPSAGGHLVSYLGTSDALGDIEPACVIDIFGVSDLATVAGDLEQQGQNSSVRRLLSGADDLAAVAKDASPITHVSADDPPFLIVHGTADVVVPYQQSTTFHEALQKAGVDSTLITVEGAGHGPFGNPKVTKLMQQFLMNHLLDGTTVIEDATLPDDPGIEESPRGFGGRN